MRTAEEYLESLRGKVWLIPKNFVEVLNMPSNRVGLNQISSHNRQVGKFWARADLVQLCVLQFPARLDLCHVTHRCLMLANSTLQEFLIIHTFLSR